ncbi:DUF397 domain-containing protein [Streptosporangium sp. NPDC002544]|uniref:DUF397 domain-containing protein n=1 Tax=Streptosporangium sp. NPDC002544 TaxID=3154538 RepID=UPI003319EFAF
MGSIHHQRQDQRIRLIKTAAKEPLDGIPQPPSPEIGKSSCSNQDNNCVEVAGLPGGSRAIRDSKNRRLEGLSLLSRS